VIFDFRISTFDFRLVRRLRLRDTFKSPVM